MGHHEKPHGDVVYQIGRDSSYTRGCMPRSQRTISHTRCRHWSVLLIGTLILFRAIERPVETLAAWTAYFGIILIHECGHMLTAQRKGYHVLAIELYPIH
jgi:hypothetical protein